MSTPFHRSEADLSGLAAYYPALLRRVEKQRKTWCDMPPAPSHAAAWG